MPKLFSFLFAAGLILLSLVRPVFADPLANPSSFPWGVEVSVPYPSDDSGKLGTIIITSPLSYAKYVSDGPTLPSEGFQVNWICPSGSILANGACFARSDGETKSSLVRPVAAQIAFAYESDDRAETIEQIIFVAQVSPDQSLLLERTSSDADLDGSAPNPRMSIKSFCPQPPSLVPYVVPPGVCAR